MHCIQSVKAIDRRRRASEPSRSIPQSILQAVRAHEFFDSVGEDVLEEVVLGLKIHSVGPGDEIVKEGTIGGSMFLLLSGTVRVSLERSEAILAELTRGAFFGEIGALYQIPRTATVSAKTICTIAILSQKTLMAAMKGRPEVLKMIVRVAQARYRQIKPESIMPGHTADHHYLMSSLRAKFPAMDSLPDEHLMQFIRIAKYTVEPAVLSGKVMLRDPSCDSEQSFEVGQVAQFREDSHFMSYLSAGYQCAQLIVPASVYYKTIEGEDLSSFEEITQLFSEISLVNSVTDSLGGPAARRRHSVSAIFQHDQTIRRSTLNPQSLPTSTVVELPQKTFDAPDSIQMLSLLLAFGVSNVDPTKLMPRFNSTEIDFSSIRSETTDQMVAETVAIFGKDILILNLSGTSITDLALEAISSNCPGLIRINIQDCIRVSSVGIERIVARCTCLAAIKAANCPGFTEDCLLAMSRAGLAPVEIDVSYCRLVGLNGWSLICNFHKTLERLIIHRSVTLNENAIMLSKTTEPLQKLGFLDLSDCAFLTTRALREILQKTPALESLNLTFCTGLDDNLAKAFSSMQDAPLKNLDLSYCSRAVTDRSISALVNTLPNLESISVRGARNITAASFKALLRLKSLIQVNASDCPKIDSDQLAEISQMGRWSTLTHEKIIY